MLLQQLKDQVEAHTDQLEAFNLSSSADSVLLQQLEDRVEALDQVVQELSNPHLHNQLSGKSGKSPDEKLGLQIPTNGLARLCIVLTQIVVGETKSRWMGTFNTWSENHITKYITSEVSELHTSYQLVLESLSTWRSN